MRDLTIEDPPIDDVIELAFASGDRLSVTAPTSAMPRAAGQPIESEGPVRAYLRLYLTLGRVSIMQQFQYRAANYFYMIGMITEPMIYLVVWSTIAREQGGSVGGYTPGTFAAYYIVWTLVQEHEHRLHALRLGATNPRGNPVGSARSSPLHPIHYDLGFFAGWKVVVIIFWIPIAIVLSLIFRPELDPTLAQIAVFGVAIWGAYLIRSLLLWMLGMITFWTTRIGAIFEAFFAAELLLSGRLLPVSLMPDWVQTARRVPAVRVDVRFPHHRARRSDHERRARRPACSARCSGSASE